jgi:hypothetical protein
MLLKESAGGLDHEAQCTASLERGMHGALEAPSCSSWRCKGSGCNKRAEQRDGEAN